MKVLRTFLLPFPNRKPYERILNYTSFCASAALTASLVEPPDLVIASSPQLLVGLSGWWAARVKKVPLVLEVRDLWPESLVGAGVGSEASLMYRIVSRIASFLYRSADSIVVVTPSFREHLIREWNVAPERIAIVQNGVETSLFSPQESGKEIRAQWGAQDKFVVSYIGTLGLAHRLDTLIGAADRLKTLAPQVFFVAVGEGADRERIQLVAQSRGLTNLLFIPQQPRERIPSYISASDACLVMLKDKQVFETVIPTKMLEFMSCAKPVILGVRGQAKQLLEAAGGGVCIEPDNPQALCSAILRLQQQPAMCAEIGRNGRSYIVRELSREKTALQYLSMLQAVLKDPPKHAAVAA